MKSKNFYGFGEFNQLGFGLRDRDSATMCGLVSWRPQPLHWNAKFN